MKSKNILNALNGVDWDMVEDAEAKEEKNKGGKIWLKWGIVAASLCLIATIALAVMPFITPTEPDSGGEYWVDDRERNNNKYGSQERGISWPWDCRAVYDQYIMLSYNGTDYRSRSSYSLYGEAIPSDMIEEKLGDTVSTGYESVIIDGKHSDIMHSIDCEIYEIKGVDSERTLAVKYSGYDEYYPFMKDDYDPPSTLGELITSLNLTENITFNSFYYYPEKQTGEHYGLDEESSAELWRIVSKYDSTECVDLTEFWDLSLVSFTLNSTVLGVHNLSLSLTDSGYLWTNIQDFGYYYYIGTDAVNEIVDFVLSRKTDPPVNNRKYLIGTVTEIGENHIKIDDSICMENPDDGIEFTVYADHMNIKRYIISGYLKVGDTVGIEHGPLPKNDYKKIRNAIDLTKVIVSTDGTFTVLE